MDTLELKKHANDVRRGIIAAVHGAKAGHPGGSLSAADIFTYLYFEKIFISSISVFARYNLFYRLPEKKTR